MTTRSPTKSTRQFGTPRYLHDTYQHQRTFLVAYDQYRRRLVRIYMPHMPNSPAHQSTDTARRRRHTDAIQEENDQSLSAFIFEEILCRWGGIAEIVTDNGPAFVKAADTLAHRYGIWHIKISAYNKQVNGLVERKHYDVRKAVMRTCGNQESQWTNILPQVFWAEWVTIHKSLDFSPFYMVQGVKL
jgi:hypothetical protein